MHARRSAPLLAVALLLLFTTCSDAPVAPSSAGIRTAPGGEPGPNPDRPGGGGGEEEAPDKSFQIIGLNAAAAGFPVDVQGVPLGQTGAAVVTKKSSGVVVQDFDLVFSFFISQFSCFTGRWYSGTLELTQAKDPAQATITFDFDAVGTNGKPMSYTLTLNGLIDAPASWLPALFGTVHVTGGTWTISGKGNKACSGEGNLSFKFSVTSVPTWQGELAPLPKATAAAAVATDGSQIYVIGGGGGDTYTGNVIQIYDPSIDTWSEGAVHVPGGLSYAIAAALSDGIHVIGGPSQVGYDRLHQVYHPATDTWTSLPDAPVRMYNTVAEVVNGKMYVPVLGEPDLDPAMYIYDPGTNTWSVGGVTTNYRRGSHTSAVLNGKIYVAGGQGPHISTLRLLERYDPVTHRWETLADMPDRKSALGGGVIDGRFCVFGGRIAQGLPTGNALPDTWCYDPASDTWMKGQDMITPRAVLGSVELGGEIYAIGGRLGESSRPTVEKLVP
jgi:hypothetical protein